MSQLKLITLVSLGVFLGACSTLGGRGRQPNFYPNEKLRAVGPARADSDKAECMRLADEYVEQRSVARDVAVETGKSAVVGTAAGAVGGAILGNTGRGTGVGAATGALIGLARGFEKANGPDASWERFVEHCLSEKGYRVYGWR